jgi:CRP-like cAMP-binding protein
MPKPSVAAEDARQQVYAHFPHLREERELLEIGAQVLEYGAGEVLFVRGNPVDQLFLLLRGRVQEEGLRRGAATLQPHLARTVEPTPQRPLPVLGFYDYLYSQRHSTHAVAASDCQVLVMDRPSFEKLLYHRPELQYALAPLTVYERLRTIPLLGHLGQLELHYLAEAVELVRTAPDVRLFQSDSPHLYLIDRGQVEVTQTDGTTVLLGNGAAFGLPGLDQQARSVATGELFRIAHSALQDLAPFELTPRGQMLRRLVPETLGQLYVFSDPAFTDDVLAQLAGYVSHYVLPTNAILTQQDELTDSLWVLMPGQRALVHALDERGQPLIPTAVVGPRAFGEAALLAQSPVEATLEAEAGGQWLRLHRADFQIFLRTNRYRLLDKLKLRGEVQLLLGDKEASERYPWLQEGEGIIWLSHRHWLVLIRKTWPSLLLFALAVVGLSLFSVVPGVGLLASIPLGLLLGLALGLLGWGVYDYLNDYIVITNHRLVRQEKILLQSVRLQETGVDKIRNVDIAKSFAGNLLGYGLLKVQTAATQGTIAFDFVPGVERVQRMLIGQMNRRRQDRASAGKLEIQRQLEGRLGLRLALPERVRTSIPEPMVLTSGPRSWLARIRSARRRRRLPRYQQDRIVWRKHWLVLARNLFWPVVLLYGLLFALFGELLLLPFSLGGWVSGPISLLLALLALVDIGVITWRVADWHNDTYEVTRDEVADVEKVPLFVDEQRRTARLVDIDNIFSEVPSTFHYLFNYGNVRLETAATEGAFTFDSVPDPSGVAAEIRRRIEEARQRVEQERARQRARELTDWFELYSRLKPTEPA